MKCVVDRRCLPTMRFAFDCWRDSRVVVPRRKPTLAKRHAEHEITRKSQTKVDRIKQRQLRGCFQTGEMAEWSNAVVLKTIEPKGSGGSNPSLSATFASGKSSSVRGMPPIVSLLRSSSVVTVMFLSLRSVLSLLVEVSPSGLGTFLGTLRHFHIGFHPSEGRELFFCLERRREG